MIVKTWSKWIVDVFVESRNCYAMKIWSLFNTSLNNKLNIFIIIKGIGEKDIDPIINNQNLIIIAE